MCEKCNEKNEDSFDTCWKCLTFSKIGSEKSIDFLLEKTKEKYFDFLNQKRKEIQKEFENVPFHLKKVSENERVVFKEFDKYDESSLIEERLRVLGDQFKRDNNLILTNGELVFTNNVQTSESEKDDDQKSEKQ